MVGTVEQLECKKLFHMPGNIAGLIISESPAVWQRLRHVYLMCKGKGGVGTTNWTWLFAAHEVYMTRKHITVTISNSRVRAR